MAVTAGATLKCTFGIAPSALMVMPKGPPVTAGGLPVATIMDFVPTVNIMPFGMCSAPTNPAVIAATTAASGVFTPAPCLPVTTSPWAPPSPTVLVGGIPAISPSSVCMCAWLGVISITSPGEFTVQAP